MPSQALEGLTTESGWKITQRLDKPLGTGGNFCVRYFVENENGETGFLKAMNFTDSMDDLVQLQKNVNEYLFECNILEHCKTKKLSRIVTPLDAGEIIVPNFPPKLNKVYYLIFEKAEGSLRDQHKEVPNKKWLPALKALHHVAVGIEQLHNIDIAHQDIKPSNVLAFINDDFKVADLGRVVDKNGTSPFCKLPFPGDHTYKSIEMFFGIQDLQFITRRSCDMYMVGSLAYQIVEDIPINASVLNEVRLIDSTVQRRPFQEALPFLLTSFNTVLNRYEDKCCTLFGEKTANSLTNIIREMCHPDPAQRGVVRFSDEVNRLSMRRYVTRLANLIRSASIAGVK